MPVSTTFLRIAMCVLACAWPIGHAHAQAYPQRAVRIIVPFAPGGGTDLIARVVAVALQKELKQPFIVENRAGAAGNIGTDLVAAAAPDGYTLVATQSGIAINETLMPAARTRVLKDLTPIALLGSSPVVIGSSAAVPAANIHELISHVRANPGKVSFTSCGVGTPQHIAGELLNSAAGTKMLHVPYKGCAPALTEVASGQVEVLFSTIANVRPYLQSGRVKVFAVTSARRSSLVPELPTVQEAGIAGYDIDVWFGLFGPAGMPREIVDKLNREINAVLAQPEIRQRLEAALFEPAAQSPDAFANLLRRDVERFARVIRNANIKPE